MGVGNQNNSYRLVLEDPNQFKTLVKNLAFCWCVFHANTFTTMPFAEYFGFRPTMLRKPMLLNEEAWKNFQDGDELPRGKIMMSVAKLIGGISAKDPDNMLQNLMIRKSIEL